MTELWVDFIIMSEHNLPELAPIDDAKGTVRSLSVHPIKDFYWDIPMVTGSIYRCLQQC
jgi:hypothetical protein